MATALFNNFALCPDTEGTSVVALGKDVKELVRARQSHVSGEPSEREQLLI